VESVGSPLLWTLFAVVVATMLALDLGVFHRKAHVVSVREAAIWSGVWVAVSLLFNALVAWRLGREAAGAFLTGYIIEKSLSVDNLFVFYLLFATFRVPDQHQHRLLFWGIIGALILRTGMVFGGSWLLTRFTFLTYVFGGVLILTGAKMLARPGKEPHPEKSRAYRLVQRIIPTTSEQHGGHFFARADGRLLATPLFITLILIELSDIVFAVDSILAIFAITADPFIVLTSNIFAVLGMRSLYFLLANLARRFVYLQPGLALVLVFVGVKMAARDLFHLPVVLSLLVVTLLIGGSVVASLIRTRRGREERDGRERREQRAPRGARKPHEPARES
jgi:tellurite resistance protein TerC